MDAEGLVFYIEQQLVYQSELMVPSSDPLVLGKILNPELPLMHLCECVSIRLIALRQRKKMDVCMDK